jgi:hypothetical protein
LLTLEATVGEYGVSARAYHDVRSRIFALAADNVCAVSLQKVCRVSLNATTPIRATSGRSRSAD